MNRLARNLSQEEQRMWWGGPLRLFSAGLTRPSNSFVAYHSNALDGFAGAYICERCHNICAGVYEVRGKWVGGCCRSA